MKKFAIFTKNDKTVKAVKNGWCWPAFFFGSLWTLFAGFWVLAIILLPVELLLNALAGQTNAPSYEGDEAMTEIAAYLALAILVIFMAIRLTLGAKGNGWRQARLLRNGYLSRDVVEASSKSQAVASYRKA